MTIPDLYSLLERLAANAEEQKRYRDAAEIKDGMKIVNELCDMVCAMDDAKVPRRKLDSTMKTAFEGMRVCKLP